MKLLMQRFRKDSGATLIEFAIVAPVLFLFIFGIIDFGVLMATQSSLEGSLSQAARQHRALARQGNEGESADIIHAYMVDIGSGLVKSNALIVRADSITWGNSGDLTTPGAGEDSNEGQSGSTDEVIHYRAFYKYHVMTPFLAPLLGGEDGVVELVASTVVQNEPAIGGSGGL